MTNDKRLAQIATKVNTTVHILTYIRYQLQTRADSRANSLSSISSLYYSHGCSQDKLHNKVSKFGKKTRPFL